MKKYTLFLFALVSLFLVSCTANMANDKLYSGAWELEYITGPRITFQGLFPDEKPVISFDSTDKMVKGTTGCNGYMAKYTMDGMKINIAQPEISTLRYCGDGEVVFLKTMRQVDAYRIESDGKLTLLMNDVPMMRFKKTAAK